MTAPFLLSGPRRFRTSALAAGIRWCWRMAQRLRRCVNIARICCFMSEPLRLRVAVEVVVLLVLLVLVLLSVVVEVLLDPFLQASLTATQQKPVCRHHHCHYQSTQQQEVVVPTCHQEYSTPFGQRIWNSRWTDIVSTRAIFASCGSFSTPPLLTVCWNVLLLLLLLLLPPPLQLVLMPLLLRYHCRVSAKSHFDSTSRF